MDAATDTVHPVAGDVSTFPWQLLRAGSVVNARYTISEMLGSGGSANVYAARDLLLGRDIALKILRPDRATPSDLARLRRETVLAQRVQNEHFVRIFDIGESEFGAFITMERIAGGTLRSHLAPAGMPVERCVAIARDVLTALSALHSGGIIHRDVKPANILIDDSGRARLADFGLAKDFRREDLHLTQTDAIVGTAAYLAPEQVLGRTPDGRSDLYAVGVVLFEMLTGDVPFQSESVLGLMLAQFRRRAPDVRKVRGDVPRWLSRIVERLLEKNPADRFQTAADALKAIESRSVPVGRRATRLAILGFAALVATGAAAWQIHSRSGGTFHGAVAAGPDTVQAIGKDGQVLWSRDGLSPHHLTPVTVKGRSVLAAFLDTGNRYVGPEKRSRLSFLEPSTGAVVDSMVLSGAGRMFPGFADEFSVDGLSAVDLDRDGDQELVVSFQNAYWPSYTMLVDPIGRSSRIILYASGHHRLVGTADVNGDGREELLLGGVNNRMGWYAGLAAVDVGKTALTPRDSLANATASTPDAEYSASSPRALVWYALLPAGYPNVGMASRAEDGYIRFSYPDGRRFDLSLDGFLREELSALPSAERRAAREEAYRQLLEGSRLFASGNHAEAARKAGVAAELSARAGDPTLREWSERAKLRAHIRAGDRESSAAVLTGLEDSSAFSGVAFDAATAMHLQGWLEDAIHWYQEGLARRSLVSGGRMPYEYLEGAVLAHVELGRWADAMSMINRFCEQYPSDCHVREIYVNLVRWMAGQRPALLAPLGHDIDLYRYWELEFRHANEESPRELLPIVRADLQRGGTAMPFLQSLEAELLVELGEHDAARLAATRALELVTALLPTNPAARAHLSKVKERALRISASAKGRDRR